MEQGRGKGAGSGGKRFLRKEGASENEKAHVA